MPPNIMITVAKLRKAVAKKEGGRNHIKCIVGFVIVFLDLFHSKT